MKPQDKDFDFCQVSINLTYFFSEFFSETHDTGTIEECEHADSVCVCVCVCVWERDIRIDKSSMFCLFLCFECQRDTAHPQLGIKVKEELSKRGKTIRPIKNNKKKNYVSSNDIKWSWTEIKKLVIPQKSNMYCKTKLTSLK